MQCVYAPIKKTLEKTKQPLMLQKCQNLEILRYRTILQCGYRHRSNMMMMSLYVVYHLMKLQHPKKVTGIMLD